MRSQNAAYTPEYLDYREKHRYIFADKYKVDVEERHLSDNQHRLIITNYTDDSQTVFEYNALCSRTELYFIDVKVAVIDCIGYHAILFSCMEHANGKKYLLYTIDLYGYCVMDLETYQTWQYVPMTSFAQQEETFIWTEAFYCDKNNLLAIDGCYWAAPFGTCLFDCSDPEKLPYTQLYDYSEAEDYDGLEIIGNPIRWNADGTLVVKRDDGDETAEKAVDVSVLITNNNCTEVNTR